MSIDRLVSIATNTFDLLSVDVFDTVLLRDHTVQRSRFLEVSRTVTALLQNSGSTVDATTLLDLRCRAHDLAYRAVNLERPSGDATLARIAQIQAELLGLDQSATHLFVAAELEIERRRLTANRPLCRLLADLRVQGKRIVALSDTPLSTKNVDSLIRDLVQDSPIQRIYTSSELGLTKHAGQAFQRVAALENIPTSRILHCGDDPHSDGAMARAAGCQAVILRRPAMMYGLRKFAAALTLLDPAIG